MKLTIKTQLTLISSFIFLSALISCEYSNDETQEVDLFQERLINKDLRQIMLENNLSKNDFLLLDAGLSLNKSINQIDTRKDIDRIMIDQQDDELIIEDWVEFSPHTRVAENNERWKIDETDELIELYLINRENADIDKAPIIAIGSEILSEIPAFKETEDLIGGWFAYNPHQTLLIDEKFAAETDHPIYVVTTTGDVDATFLNVTESDELSTTTQRIANTDFEARIEWFNISKRYDNSKHSEYSYVLVYWPFPGAWQKNSNREEIWEVHKNNIGVNHFRNKRIWQLDHYDFFRFHIITFEYDWYAGKKNVNIGGGIIVPNMCKMSSSNNWYQIGYYDWEVGEATITSKGFVHIYIQ